MIDTIIVSGGSIDEAFALDFLRKNITAAAPEKVLLAAADSGYAFFKRVGITPDLAVGDFDSLSLEGRRALDAEQHTEVIRLKPEKDDSDTQSTLNTVIRRGSKEIAILGATGTRLDHMLANLGLLLLGAEQNADITIVDAHNYMKLIPSGTVLHRDEQFGKYVSFFPLGGDVTGLTLRGFKYALDGYHLRTRDSGLTVSNEILEEKAMVTYESGTLLMIMSRD